MPPCKKPYIPKGSKIPCPCGKCSCCRTAEKQLKTHRIILESRMHEKNSFVTLTYAEENMPLNDEGTPTLVPAHMQNFLKRLRNRVPNKIRFFGVGEYGTAGERGINPHFHLCLFGVGQEQHQAIDDSWRVGRSRDPIGFTHVGELNQKSAAYVAGYVQKKNQYNADMYEELNIHPEFARMSNRPGIGALAVPLIAEVIKNNPETLTPTGDVPISLIHGQRQLPLGKYLREKLREELELDHLLETKYDENTGEILGEKKIWLSKEEQKKLYETELSLLQQNAQEDQKLPKDATASLRHLHQYKHKQQILNHDKKQEIYRKQKLL